MSTRIPKENFPNYKAPLFHSEVQDLSIITQTKKITLILKLANLITDICNNYLQSGLMPKA
jgi:hypothetical protein